MGYDRPRGEAPSLSLEVCKSSAVLPALLVLFSIPPQFLNFWLWKLSRFYRSKRHTQRRALLLFVKVNKLLEFPTGSLKNGVSLRNCNVITHLQRLKLRYVKTLFYLYCIQNCFRIWRNGLKFTLHQWKSLGSSENSLILRDSLIQN